MAHYCIGNPCWICFPEYAPTPENKDYNIVWNEELKSRVIPDNNISGKLRDLLIRVFEQGLDEDTHFWALGDTLDLEKIKAERAKISSDSFEAKLLDLMIEDFENKTH